MTFERNTPYTNVNLTTAARDRLRQLTIDLTTPAGRRVSMSDVLLALARLGEQHRDQLISQLRNTP